MACRTREHLIGLVLVPVLMLGLSACLPSETNGFPSDSNSTPPVAGTAQANSAQANTAQGTPAQDTPASTAPEQASSGPSNPEPETTAQSTPTQTTTAVPQPTPKGPGSSSSPAEAEETPSAEGASQDPIVVDWLPKGPIGPNDPIQGQRYLQLEQFHCEMLAQSVAGEADAAVWQAGAAVCRALQTGSQEDWQSASIAVGKTPRIPQRQCLEFGVATTLASVVAQYRKNPGAVFKAEPGTGEACPRQLLGLTVVDEDLLPVTGMGRASGPRAGGTIVRLDGYYVQVGDVLFDGVPTVPDIVAGGGAYQTLYLRMPPAEGRDAIRISITDTVDVAGTVTFFFDDSAVSSSTAHSMKPAAKPLETGLPPKPGPD